MAEFDYKEYAREMRENAVKDSDGVIRCSPELWEQIANIIENTPTANVAEVKHGKWKHLGGDEWICTHCGEVITTEGSWKKPTKKYCNECGAKMDE